MDKRTRRSQLITHYVDGIPKRKMHLLTVTKAAEYLGIDSQMLKKIVEDGEIRRLKSINGKTYYVFIEDLFRYVERNRALAIYVPPGHTDDVVIDTLVKKASRVGLAVKHLIVENIAHVQLPIMWRDGFALALSMWKSKEIEGIVSSEEFIGKDAQTMGWILAIQRLGFYVYVEEDAIVTMYPYRLNEFENLYQEIKGEPYDNLNARRKTR